MDRETLRANLSRIPVKDFRILRPSSEHFWENDYKGAHFIVTKEELPLPGRPAIYVFSVSGHVPDIEELALSLLQHLGKPNDVSSAENIVFLVWFAARVENRLRKA